MKRDQLKVFVSTSGVFQLEYLSLVLKQEESIEHYKMNMPPAQLCKDDPHTPNMEEVKLLGTWPSPFLHRVIWVLKLKGVAYEYIEEDLSNKSPLLLQYNPVHKKIPVLVHGGKPISESVVILEYIDEKWPQNPLMPQDPYGKAMARFWTKFVEDKVPTMLMLIFGVGEEVQEKAMKECLEVLRVIEEHGVRETNFFSGDSMGLPGVAFGAMANWLVVMEEVLGVKLLEEESFPRLCAWFYKFKEQPAIKENLPDHAKMVHFFKQYRERVLASPST